MYKFYVGFWLFVPYVSALLYLLIKDRFEIEFLLFFFAILLTWNILKRDPFKSQFIQFGDIRRLANILFILAVIFSALNYIRVFGTLSPYSILEIYRGNSLRAVEYMYGGNPILNNLHMLAGLGLALNMTVLINSPSLLRLIIVVVCLVLTLSIPIKTMIVESFLLAFILSIKLGNSSVLKKYTFTAIALLGLVIVIDAVRIHTVRILVDTQANFYDALFESLGLIFFYISAGFVNLLLVVQEFGILGNGTFGGRIFSPLLDMLAYLGTGERLLERGYTGKTGMDGLILPEISKGVNIYTSFLSPYLDFGILGFLILPAILGFYKQLSKSLFRVQKESAIFFYCLFLAMVLPSFAWSLKLFYSRYILYFAVVFMYYKSRKARS